MTMKAGREIGRKVGNVFPGSEKIMWVGEYKTFWRMSGGSPGLASMCRICEGEGWRLSQRVSQAEIRF